MKYCIATWRDFEVKIPTDSSFERRETREALICSRLALEVMKDIRKEYKHEMRNMTKDEALMEDEFTRHRFNRFVDVPRKKVV